MQTIGRPRVAQAYVWLTALVATIVFIQGGLFAGFYSEGESGLIDAHQWVGEISGYIAVVVLIPLAFVARFPRELSRRLVVSRLGHPVEHSGPRLRLWN